MTIETNLVVTQARPIELAIDMIAAQSWCVCVCVGRGREVSSLYTARGDVYED